MKAHNFVAAAAAVTAGAFGAAMLNPTVTEKAEATVNTNTSFTATSDQVLAISVSGDVTMDLTPSFSSSTFASGSATVTMSTNAAYGYTLYMGTTGTDASGTATTALIHESDSSSTIPTLSSSVTATNFASTSDTTSLNKWGYSLDKTTYYPMQNSTISTSSSSVSGSAIVIKETDSAVSSDTTTVTFGAKVDSTIPSGDYSNTITFTAIANPKVNYMQDMTATLCKSLDQEVTYEFTDKRDGNVYNIARLKDGNCWMQKNLALGTSDSAGLTLTADDSNVTSDWTLPAYSSIGTTWSYNTNTAYVIQGSTSITKNTDYSRTADWSDGMGNWYTWGAATAGTASSATSSNVNASASICPKGWRLPIGGSSSAWSSTTSKSFGNLFRAYSLTSSSSTTSSAIQASPLSFTRAGFYNYYNGQVYNVGNYGNYWSSTAYDANNAYYLNFDSSYVNPQSNDSRGDGLSVRCVSAG